MIKEIKKNQFIPASEIVKGKHSPEVVRSIVIPFDPPPASVYRRIEIKANSSRWICRWPKLSKHNVGWRTDRSESENTQSGKEISKKKKTD